MSKISPNPSPSKNARVVAPLNARRETIGVLIAVELIVLLMVFRFVLVSDEEHLQYLQPHQQLDTMLTGTQRSLYQTLLSAITDIEFLWDQQGQWPEIALLKQEEVPPFAPEFLPSALQAYTWTRYAQGTWVDYLGNNPMDSNAHSFILRVIDLHADYHPHPHPGQDYDPNQRLAVQLWVYPEPIKSYPGERITEANWWWVMSSDDPSLLLPREDRPPSTQTNNAGKNQ
jgi:hypothetical protein